MIGWTSAALEVIDDRIIVFPHDLNMPLLFDFNEGVSLVPDIANIDGIIPFQRIERIFYCGKNLCSISMDGDSLLLYDISKKEIEKVDINLGEKSYGNFSYILSSNNIIDFFMCEHGALYRLNVDTMNIKRMNYCDEGFVSLPWCGVRYEDEVIFVSDENEFVRYNINGGGWEKLSLGEEIAKIHGVELIEDDVVILCEDGNSHWLNLKTNRVKKSIKISDNGIGSLCKTISKEIYLPSTGKDIIIFDDSTGTRSLYDDYPTDFKYDLTFPGAKYSSSSYCETSNIRFYANIASDYIVGINKITSEIQWRKLFQFSEQSRIEIIENLYIYSKGIVKERGFNLADFLAYVLKVAK